ncbi:hypothetical protein [Sulfobacillus thermosulfidooxidans]|uniref:hypothetical protein n=1 Tax=Sulfobacillus thermosulfidooxidans TaxID=28034 RepID=UPI0004239680|nr:hypothetical protein [Sulfobacillus thermosulfidooxidans]
MDYTSIIEQPAPETWPGSTLWRDEWGSVGTFPDHQGFGSEIMRFRVPSRIMAKRLDALMEQYRSKPFVRVSPRETLGLKSWLMDHQYRLRERQMLMIWPARAATPQPSEYVHEVLNMEQLARVNALDHRIFQDPVLEGADLHKELQRLQPQSRRLFYIPVGDLVISAGGLSRMDSWALLWGGETHPDFQHHGWYRLMVEHRLFIAQDQWSVQFVATYANSETSAPILVKMGFQLWEMHEIYAPPHAIKIPNLL